jgi:hypothetical protein
VAWIGAELALIALAAMLSPTDAHVLCPMAFVLLILVVASLLRNGIAGLTS